MNRYDVKASLLRALNQAHPELRFDLQPGDVSFGKPELFLQNLCNSRIKITALDSSIHFKNQGQFFYNRRRLDQYLKGIRVPGKPSDYSDTRQVIQALVDRYHLPLVPDEFTFSGVYHNTVELKPLDTCVGFFTNFTATLGYIDLKPFVTNGTKISLSNWTITAADGKQYPRRSMGRTDERVQYYGTVDVKDYAIGDNPAVGLRGVETGADVIDNLPAWMWCSVQFFGPVAADDLCGLVRFNGIWGKMVSCQYNEQYKITFVTYALESSVANFTAGTSYVIDF